MTNQTIEDVSNVASTELATPAIVLIASGTSPRELVITPSGPAGVVQLGRRIASGAFVADIDDERMSREHATVQWVRDGWRIVDQGSRNGTHVDGERIDGAVHRHADVVLRLGHSVFVLVRDGRGHAATSDADATVDTVIGPELARVYGAIRRHATTGDTLLVHGESGTGKELVARLFHDTRTPDGPFVAVNCATIPEGVAERLLFGSKRGAYSGAVDAAGYIQTAHGGTLFLDEIADLHPAVQAKLLRVLEAREVMAVGATSPIAVDIGIVAASHRELRAAVNDKQFRDDLYYRLARAVVRLPPLRARKIDAARLAVRELAAVDRKLVAHAKLIEACCARAWPGNVRELRTAVRQAAQQALHGGRDVVRADDLPPHAGMIVASASPLSSPPAPPPSSSPSHDTPDTPVPHTPPLGTAVPDRATVIAALARAGGVISVAARELGLHRTQLYRVMERLGITRDEP